MVINMEITYIGHSGFLIEWEACYWLFDYYQGTIPEMDLSKKVFVFVSHGHGDHYNPEIFKLFQKHSNITYLLSSDITVEKEMLKKSGISNQLIDKIIVVEPSKEYKLPEDSPNKTNNIITLKTLKSTDSGVAFLLNYKDKTIYHAGDLNLWVWKGESKQYNDSMTAMFDKEIGPLKGIPIDVAFAPLDPRQEDWYDKGLNKLLSTTKVTYLFPMHFWEKPSVIGQYKQEQNINKNDTKVMDIEQAGQKWTIES
ncbi:MAG: MBL fold metallo-hydrolase [Mobilitalea sp.]